MADELPQVPHPHVGEVEVKVKDELEHHIEHFKTEHAMLKALEDQAGVAAGEIHQVDAKPAEGKTLFGIDLAKHAPKSAKVIVKNLSGKHVQLGNGLSLKPGAQVEAHPDSQIAHAVAAANKEAFLTGADPKEALKKINVSITNHRPCTLKAYYGHGKVIDVKTGQTIVLQVTKHVFHQLQQLNGAEVHEVVMQSPSPYEKAKMYAQMQSMGLVGYHSSPDVWMKDAPPIKFDTAHAEEVLAAYGDDDAYKTMMMEKQAAGMALVTLADVEKYLELRGYTEFEVDEIDGTVIVMMKEIYGDHIENLRAELRVRMPVTVQVEVWPR